MNKVVWITGASSGIGKSLALKFAKEGWNVAISARRENLLNEISESNEKIKSFPLDVTDKKKCIEVFQHAAACSTRRAHGLDMHTHPFLFPDKPCILCHRWRAGCSAARQPERSRLRQKKKKKSRYQNPSLKPKL